MARREFLKGMTLVGGLAILASVLPSCLSSPQETPEPVQSTGPRANEQEGSMTKIALVRTKDRHDGVKRAVSLLGLSSIQGKSVVLKPNFNTADPAPASTRIERSWRLIALSIRG